MGWGINHLKKLKINQTIRQEGPKEHQSKSGTPTMGGIIIIPTGLFIGNLITNYGESNNQIISISLLTLSFMLIGVIDDWKSISKQTNEGLSGKSKLILQAIAGSIFLLWVAYAGWINSTVNFPFNYSLSLGYLIWPLSLFVILAESNSTNLTDGLDGLASGCGALVFIGLGINLILQGNSGNPAIAAFCVSMGGSWIGFLIHNQNPARIFMGDTGSLGMGASLSGIAIITNNLWALFLMGGVFCAESISVISQVWFFKITKKFSGKGKRLFLMAPLHHHYELKGYSEKSIVKLFWCITLILVLVTLALIQ